MKTAAFNIATVERDTGLSKDVLRMWERRYGFPCPERDSNGERSYPTEQVERLRLIKRLMDQGHRPGKLIGLDPAALNELAPKATSSPETETTVGDQAVLQDLLGLIKNHDVNGYVNRLQTRLAREGLYRFVLYTVAPLTSQVGAAWESGYFEVFDEHLFTELTKRVLRQAIATLPSPLGSPRVLLTSVPDEQHVLGLLMVEALLTLEGAECIPLGTQMPLLEISRAATAHQADIVALSFSASFSARQTPTLLQQLRELLPESVELWAGGSGVARITCPDGVWITSGLENGIEALNNWRSRRLTT